MTVTKRRVTQPEIELQAIADIATWLAHQWPAIEATYAALAAPTIRAAGNPTRHNNTPDPTPNIVASLTPYSETREAITGALTQMRWLQTRARNILRHHPDIAADATATIRAMRCSGEIDPTCTRNAVRAGLCWRCYRAHRRGEAP